MSKEGGARQGEQGKGCERRPSVAAEKWIWEGREVGGSEIDSRVREDRSPAEIVFLLPWYF